ncbi:hypothetical protein TNCV_874141 [Trichonephila clavipes]|nr:hypothetical protein TNCV_874141 [Trichonephila clavipes]
MSGSAFGKLKLKLKSSPQRSGEANDNFFKREEPPSLYAARGAFGDGPRNFEPWSSDVTHHPELAPPLLTTTPHQREWTFQLSTDLACIAALHGGVFRWYWDRTRDKASHDPMPIPLGYRGQITVANIRKWDMRNIFFQY